MTNKNWFLEMMWPEAQHLKTMIFLTFSNICYFFSILKLVTTSLDPLIEDTNVGEKNKERILFSTWWTNLQRYVKNLDRTKNVETPKLRKTSRMVRNVKFSGLNRKSVANISNNIIPICTESDGSVSIQKLRKLIEDTGVRWTDERLKKMVKAIEEIQNVRHALVNLIVEIWLPEIRLANLSFCLSIPIFNKLWQSTNLAIS